MSDFDPNYKRLKIILVLFLFLTGIYLLEWGCFVYYPTLTEEQEGYMFDIETMEYIPYENLTNAERQKLNELIGEDFDWFGFMFFALDETPDWITTIFAPISIILWMVSIYMIMDYMIAW
ncbi:unnamed protein product, partial [marine sediment metagenome]